MDSRERAYTEDTRVKLGAPTVGYRRVERSRTARWHKKTGISVKVMNPCPAGDIEHEFALAAYNRSRSRR